MGQRAYRIIRVETDEEPLFKVGDNLYNWLDERNKIHWDTEKAVVIQLNNLQEAYDKKDEWTSRNDWQVPRLKRILEKEKEKGNTEIEFEIW